MKERKKERKKERQKEGINERKKEKLKEKCFSDKRRKWLFDELSVTGDL